MALDACVENVICSLLEPELQAVLSLISTYKTLASAQIAALGAQITLLEIQAVPVNLAVDLAQAALDELTSVTNFLPAGSFEDCPDLGDIMVNIKGLTDLDTASLRDYLTDAVRINSVTNALRDTQARLETFAADLDDLELVVNDCIIQAQQG